MIAMMKSSTHFHPFKESLRCWEQVTGDVEWTSEQLTER
ncbi:hypothetical protein C2W63_00292 [Bacillus velezensis]|nr:hypothetical protein C2W63_00292 [Bacillus velezensis]RUR97367.1 hypothetical protein EFW57_02873 [Bacillus velezensis]